jgi:hypothetical protein
VRTLAVALVVAAVGAAAAGAAVKPPPRLHVFFPRQVVHRDRQHSCAVGVPKSIRIPGPRGIVDSARKAVVACEQPPRANVVNAAGTLLGAVRP